MKKFLWGGVLALVPAWAAAAQEYQFTINPAPSGVNGTLAVDLSTTGTLIGDWDPVNNPTGTRTKPGLFGTFGETENVAVPVQVGPRVAGNLNSDTAGGFRMNLDQGSGTLSMDSYSANFLNSGAINLPVTLSLLFDSFRTRQPSSTYIGGIPLNLPFGQASLTQFAAVQVGAAQGTLTPTGPGTYDFLVVPIVQVTAEFSVLGNVFSVPGAPTPLALGGTLSLSGNTAQLLSVQPLTQNTSVMPNLALPQLPLDLPTVLPAGSTSHLLMDLTLSEIAADVDLMVTTNATGTLVPAPAGLLVLAGGLAAGRRRRR